MKEVSRFFRRASLSLPLLGVVLLLAAQLHVTPVAGQSQIAIVSAASFAPNAPVAPDSIVSAFGTRLATRSEAATGATLPTTLAGTTVRINGELAPLFFVSPGQINFLIPPGVPAGTASVVVTAGDGTVSNGTAQIATVAPALFTANATGQGALAAVLLRVKADGQQLFEPLAQLDQTTSRFVTRPFDFGAESDQLFLILYLTGLRQAPQSSVRVNLGGVEFAPLYAGRQGSLAGLDQVNLALPRSFGGRGRITLFVRASGAGASNAGEFEIGAGTASGNTIQITPPVQAVLAGNELEISGSGFAANPNENTVQIVADDGVTAKADVLAVGSTSLRLRVPFGAGTGQLKVSRGQIEASAAISVRTSVSGFIERFEQGQRVSIRGARVQLHLRPETARTTDAEGSFVLPDVAPGNRFDFDILPPTDGSLNFPPKSFSLRVRAGRDNQLPRGEEQTLITGVTLPAQAEAEAAQTETTPSVEAASPDQTPILTFLPPGRTPANLPAGHFSTSIAQVTPFGVTFAPGRKLTFPNSDALPVGTPAQFFKFDQTNGSATLGQFVEIGTATVTADGQRVETGANAITEGSFYFVSIARPLAALNGRVLESDGRPVPRAIVQARGQSTFTDGFGGFVLSNVPVLRASGDRLRVEVSYQRPDGRVMRKGGNEVELAAGALATVRPDIVLDPVTLNLPPVLLAPTNLTLTAGVAQQFDFVATDPGNSQLPQVLLPTGTATAFTTLFNQGGGAYRLNLSPAANATGNYTLNLTAVDSANARSTQSISIIVNPASLTPVAQGQAVITPEDTAKTITLVGRDAGGRTLSYSVVSLPARGNLNGTPPNVAYTPGRDFNGVDSFSFKVSNGSAESAVATVFIAVSPVNDAPVLNLPAALEVNAGETLNLLVTAADVDGEQVLRFEATGLPPGATLTEASTTSRLLSWTPTFTQLAPYTVSITVTDNGTPPLSQTKQLRLVAGAKWAKTSGPEGGKVFSLFTLGADIFAGANGGGVFRSSDNGRSWTELNEGLGNTFVHAFAANGETLYAATESGVFRSTERGAHWRAANRGIEDVTVFSLGVSRNALLAGTSGNGIFRSTDGGNTWQPANRGLPNDSYINAFVVAEPAIFAGSYNGGVFRSTDDGVSWLAINKGLPANVHVVALIAQGGRLYAGAESDTETNTLGGVYVSTDNGANWTALNNGLPEPRSLYVRSFGVNGNTLFAGASYAGLFRLANQGQSWEAVNTGLHASAQIYAIAAQGGQVLVATFGQGIFRSADNGQRWAASNSGLTTPFVLALAVSGADLFAGSIGGGIFRTSDQGATWTAVNQGLENLDVESLLAVGTKLFAGTQDYVYRSTNRGASWTRIANGLEDSRIRALAERTGTLFAGTDSKGVFRSTDDGANWRAANNGLTSLGIGALASTSQYLFASTFDGGVFRSADQGTSWTAANNGLPRPEVNAYAVEAIGDLLLVGTTHGVFRSTNQGQSWTAAELEHLVYDFKASNNVIFAATESSGVFFSVNQGVSWTPVNDGLANLSVDALAVSGNAVFLGFPGGVARLGNNTQSWTGANGNLPTTFTNTVTASGGNLFTGTLGSGLFRSDNQGQSWTALNLGLPPNANLQAVVTNGATLWAAVFGNGVYRSVNQGASWTMANFGLANLFVNRLFLSGATLYAGTDSGVFRTLDGGQTWTALTAGLGNLRVVSFTAEAGVIYAGSDNGGVFRLNPEGTSWRQINRGLSSLAVTALGTSNGLLYAGTSGGGICISRDGGENWTPVNNQLPANLNVFAFAVSGKKVYAGSVYGVFVTEDEGQSWKQVNAGLLNTFVTGLAVGGEQLFASTASGGVFVSRIPQ